MRRLSLMLALVGCSSGELVAPEGLERPPDAKPFEPPAIYAQRYWAMERCAGRSGDFGRVRWFTVPGHGWESTVDGARVAAQWWPPHDIYLAESVVNNMDAVDHEILHDIMRTGSHPEPPFEVCAPTRLSTSR